MNLIEVLINLIQLIEQAVFCVCIQCIRDQKLNATIKHQQKDPIQIISSQQRICIILFSKANGNKGQKQSKGAHAVLTAPLMQSRRSETTTSETSQTSPSVRVSAKRASNFLHRLQICAGCVSTAGKQVESPSWRLLTHCLISPAIMLNDKHTKPDTKHNKALLLCNQRQLGEQRRGDPATGAALCDTQT